MWSWFRAAMQCTLVNIHSYGRRGRGSWVTISTTLTNPSQSCKLGEKWRHCNILNGRLMGNCGFWSPEWAHQVHSSPAEASQEGKRRSQRTYESHRTVLKKERESKWRITFRGTRFLLELGSIMGKKAAV